MPDKVNNVVLPSPVNVSVDETVGLFNLFCIAKALTLFKSITGDTFAFVVIKDTFTNIDLEFDISLVWFIELATNLGSLK